jgi:hypothetical protein
MARLPGWSPYYRDICQIKITADGQIDYGKNPEFAPNEEEMADLSPKVLNDYLADKPKPVNATIAGAHEIRRERGIKPENFFICVDSARIGVIWVQWRKGDGKDKRYYPLTFFSDGKWRDQEPGGERPFWKPLTNRNKIKLMIHEGAKAASYVDWMCNANELEAKTALKAHPWGEDLCSYEHWGIMGGALSPHCADWEEVRREKFAEVVYACDCDPPGEEALPKVSEIYGEPLIGIKGDGRFGNHGWDMADRLPDTLWKKNKAGVTCYAGPTLQQLMVPATWATEQVTITVGEDVKDVWVLKKTFKAQWVHSITPEAFINRRFPWRVYYTAKEFNARVAAFTNVPNVAAMLLKDDRGTVDCLDYNPGLLAGDIIVAPRRAFNTFQPSDIRPCPGNTAPWLEFLAHLIPDPGDQLIVQRWVATLIARPDVRMKYGLLLISETQGVGKSTLAEILARAVGSENASHPTENDLTQSAFNDWKNRKRLIVIHEIYQGESAKQYNKLKDTITENIVTVNRKNVPQHEMPNWCHVIACSNSPKALLLPDEDRRWVVPEVTEKLTMEEQSWERFYDWLEIEGGYGIIVNWAHEFLKTNEPVGPGDHAPETEAKKKMIREGYSRGKELVADWLEATQEEKTIVIVTTDKAFVEMIKIKLYNNLHNDKLEREMTIRKLAKAYGRYVGEKRVFISAMEKKARLIANAPGWVDKTEEELQKAHNAAVKEAEDANAALIAAGRPQNVIPKFVFLDQGEKLIAFLKKLHKM